MVASTWTAQDIQIASLQLLQATATHQLPEPYQTIMADQNSLEENIPERITTLAKGHINDIFAIKVNTWWTEMVSYASSGKETATRASQGSVKPPK